ncbi:MAG: DUF1592 domain-containing protein [Opitutaceae bacterium]
MSQLRTSHPWLVASVVASATALLMGSGCGQTASLPAGAPAAKAVMAAPQPSSREHPAVAQFHKSVQPILEARCYECHGDGSKKGGIAFDALTSKGIAQDPQLWLKVLKNTRSHIMPPLDADNPLTTAERAALEGWITTSAFGLDPAQPDPGRVTVHRLNRVEYKNTIRDLMGVHFETNSAFPDDDSGYGFDNIADVLNMSPLLMEKYLAAAHTVVEKAVPKVTLTPAVQIADVGDFKYADGTATEGKLIRGSGLGAAGIPAIPLTFAKEAAISHVFDVKQAGDYRLVIEQNIRGDFTYVPQRAQLTVTVDGGQVSQRDYGWSANRHTEEVHAVHWEPGNHAIGFAITPLPSDPLPRGGQDVVYNLKKVRLEGPLDPARWVHPPNYTRFFTRAAVPADPAQRRAYAKEVLGAFATKAFRRPATSESVEPLVDIAEKYSVTTPGATFEAGIGQAMMAVLASPRFLYRVEKPALTPGATLASVAPVDEHSLASRLSYFLWSTMPDDELLKLAAAGQLRANLGVQVKRMLADPRSAELVEHFTGQWLQSRLVTSVPLNPREILQREGITVNAGRGGGGGNVSDALRTAFKEETEKYFEHVVREDRSVDEFLTSDYTFLNETLASSYKIEGVKGPELRKVTLAAGDPRGGMLTMGSVLMITSNPTRTSPVKRGKWILDNILDAPTPPPPPDIPALEEAKPKDATHVPTLRETMAVHREDALCASCHNRMDPLGLALENFNALGQWRTEEYSQKIDPSGQLATGETFTDIRDLKRILAANHKTEFYRCLTEKLLIYALGRGTEYYDVPAVDKIVANLEKNHGKFSTLLMGVIESVPFQQQRLFPHPVPDAAKPAPRFTQTNPAP